MPGSGTFGDIGDSTRYHELLRDDGYLNEMGQHLLIELLGHVEPEKWGDAFIPLKKMGVHCAVEPIILSDHGILLTWRDDQFFRVIFYASKTDALTHEILMKKGMHDVLPNSDIPSS